MKRLQKIFILPFLLASALLLTGCIEKTIYPEVALEIPAVTPYELYATATDTASLPTTSITVTSISKIPCNLKSYSINYNTQYGENIPSLNIAPTPINIKLAAEGSIDVVVKPFTSRVVSVFELSNSDISPITATVNLVFEDYNGNMVSKEGHCLLYKP